MRVSIVWGDGATAEWDDGEGTTWLENQPDPSGPRGIDLAYWLTNVIGDSDPLLHHVYQQPGVYAIWVRLYPEPTSQAIAQQLLVTVTGASMTLIGRKGLGYYKLGKPPRLR